jgi:hypothetical protein
MIERVSRPVAWRALTLVVAIAGAAACNATGQTAMPSAATIPASAPSVTPVPSGPTAFSTTTFGVPFSLTLPAGWKVLDD